LRTGQLYCSWPWLYVSIEKEYQHVIYVYSSFLLKSVGYIGHNFVSDGASTIEVSWFGCCLGQTRKTSHGKFPPFWSPSYLYLFLSRRSIYLLV
jgi:hypothetical protein